MKEYRKGVREIERRGESISDSVSVLSRNSYHLPLFPPNGRMPMENIAQAEGKFFPADGENRCSIWRERGNYCSIWKEGKIIAAYGEREKTIAAYGERGGNYCSIWREGKIIAAYGGRGKTIAAYSM